MKKNKIKIIKFKRINPKLLPTKMIEKNKIPDAWKKAAIILLLIILKLFNLLIFESNKKSIPNATL